MIQKSNHKIGEIKNEIQRSQKQMHELEYHLRQRKVCVGKLTLRVFFFLDEINIKIKGYKRALSCMYRDTSLLVNN